MTFVVVVVVVVVDKKYQMKHNERIYVSCLSAATERYHGCYSYFYDYYNDYFYTVSLLLPVVALWPAMQQQSLGIAMWFGLCITLPGLFQGVIDYDYCFCSYQFLVESMWIQDGPIYQSTFPRGCKHCVSDRCYILPSLDMDVRCNVPQRWFGSSDSQTDRH